MRIKTRQTLLNNSCNKIRMQLKVVSLLWLVWSSQMSS